MKIKFLSYLIKFSILLIVVGICGIMNEFGEVQPVAVIISCLGIVGFSIGGLIWRNL